MKNRFQTTVYFFKIQFRGFKFNIQRKRYTKIVVLLCQLCLKKSFLTSCRNFYD